MMNPIYVFILRNDVWIYIIAILGLLWYVNEYYTAAGQASSAAGWQTRIASFKMPGCYVKTD